MNSSESLDEAIAALAANLDRKWRYGRVTRVDVERVRKARQVVEAIPCPRVREAMEGTLAGQLRTVLEDSVQRYQAGWRSYLKTIDGWIDSKVRQLFAKDAFEDNREGIRALMAFYRPEKAFLDLLNYTNDAFLKKVVPFDEENDFKALQTFLACGVEITEEMMKIPSPRIQALLEAEILRRNVTTSVTAATARIARKTT